MIHSIPFPSCLPAFHLFIPFHSQTVGGASSSGGSDPTSLIAGGVSRLMGLLYIDWITSLRLGVGLARARAVAAVARAFRCDAPAKSARQGPALDGRTGSDRAGRKIILVLLARRRPGG